MKSYGPAPSEGDWTEKELYAFAKESGVFASKLFGSVETRKRAADHGRYLSIVGTAKNDAPGEWTCHFQSVPLSKQMKALRVGIDNKAGIWEKGHPEWRLLLCIHKMKSRIKKYTTECVI